MNPANKEMERHGTVCSGTGVFYQAMPAIGADGRNIMKLIPVQKVNGQFVLSQMSCYRRDDAEPQRPITLNYASAPVQIRSIGTLEPSANGQYAKKRVSFTSGSPNRVGETGKGLDSASNLLTKIAQCVSSTPDGEKLVTLSSQLPVTVKSPVLPNGQYLQIPPNARVRTLSVSELPPAIKKQIFTSSANSISNSSLPTVLYVSPVKTMNQDITPPLPPSATPLPSLQLLSKSSNQTSFGPGSTFVSRSIAKESRKHNGPLKWVIEEEDGSLAPCLVPANSPIMTSEILKAVAERENTNKPYENTTKKTPIPQSNPPKSGQGKDNALVMCNGKVYFVAKKCNLPFSLDSENTGAVNSDEVRKTKSLPSQLSKVSVAFQASHTRQESSQIIILDGSDEVIDLCDDDSQDDLPHRAGSQPDEDNVIFVSYIPPKSVSTSGEHQGEMAQVNEKAAEHEVEKDVDQEIARGHGNVTGQKVVSIRDCLNVGTAHPCKVSEEVYGTQERATGQEKEPSKLISTDKNIETNNNHQKINNEHSATTQHTESMEGPSINQEMENSLHDDNIPDNTHSHSSGREMGSIQSDSNGQKINNQHSATTQQMKITDAQPIDNLHDDNTPDNADRQSGPCIGMEGETHTVDRPCIRMEGETHTVDRPCIRMEGETHTVDRPCIRMEGETHTVDRPCIRMEGETHTVDISTDPVSNQKSSQSCDHLLRKMFGITSAVKIYLMRINANKSVFVPEVPPKIASISNSTLEGIHELIQESKSGMRKREHEESQESQKRSSDSCPADAKKLKLKTFQDASEDAVDGLVAPSPQVDMGPLIESNPQLETKPLISPSPQMESKSFMTQSPPKEILHDGEYEQMFGYGEPIEEDFTPTADKNDIPNAQDESTCLQTETSGIDCSPGACCTDLNTKPRRRGRPRKCTVCPCGTTGTPVKKSAKSSITKQKEPDLAKQKGSVKRETGKKTREKRSGKPNVTAASKKSKGQSENEPREDKCTPVGIQCLSTKSSNRTYGEIPTSNDLSTTSMDSEEIKRHEQIKRLQDLLKEKEAALETLRKSMG